MSDLRERFAFDAEGRLRIAVDPEDTADRIRRIEDIDAVRRWLPKGDGFESLLGLAVVAGLTEIVAALWERSGGNLHAVDSRPRRSSRDHELLVASLEHDPRLLELLLSGGLRAHSHDATGRSVLEAAATVSLRAVNTLLAAGARTPVDQGRPCPPCAAAAEAGRYDVLGLFQSQLAEIDHPGSRLLWTLPAKAPGSTRGLRPYLLGTAELGGWIGILLVRGSTADSIARAFADHHAGLAVFEDAAQRIVPVGRRSFFAAALSDSDVVLVPHPIDFFGTSAAAAAWFSRLGPTYEVSSMRLRTYRDGQLERDDSFEDEADRLHDRGEDWTEPLAAALDELGVDVPRFEWTPSCCVERLAVWGAHDIRRIDVIVEPYERAASSGY